MDEPRIELRIEERPVTLKLVGGRNDLKRINEAMSFRPPEYWRAHSYTLFQQSGGARGWDGFLRPFTFQAETVAIVLRGHLETVLKHCEAFDIDTKLALLVRPFAELVPDDLPDDLIKAPFELDEDQRICIVELLKHTYGTARVTVSGGKTAIFAGAMAAIKRQYPAVQFLYMTQAERLVSQVYEEMQKFLPSWTISKYGGGSRELNGDLVVATTQMIHKNFNALRAEKFFARFHGLMVDECHHASSRSMEKIIRACVAMFRFGASDSVKEQDIVKGTLIRGLLGPIRHIIDAEPLIDVGRIARPQLYLVHEPAWANKFEELRHEAKEGSEVWALVDGEWLKGKYRGPVYKKGEDNEFLLDKHGEKIQIESQHLVELNGFDVELPSRWCLLNRLHDKAIVNFKERNQLITDWVEHFSGEGLRTLVVATRTLHILILQGMIRGRLKAGDNLRLLFSDHSPKERDATFKWFKETPGAILISSIVKEGVNIPEIGAGVIADYVASEDLLNQIIGRMIRRKPEGDNVGKIVVFIENQHPRYKSSSMKLLKKMEKRRGYTFFYPCSTPDKLNMAEVINACNQPVATHLAGQQAAAR